MVAIARLAAVAAFAAGTTLAATSDVWRTQSIYQVLTDRYATPDGSSPSCDINSYCGGTWQGIINKLDYIQGMGFTAVYISPVTQNFLDNTADGYSYHGYWPQDIYSVNSKFGTAADLVALSAALHKRNMLLMVDVVVNDMAIPVNGVVTNSPPIDYSIFNPFNDAKYYHPFCAITDWNNVTNYQDCWFSVEHVAMPDIRTESSVVQDMFGKWVKELVSNYSIDGLRIDGVKQVEMDFFPSFTAASGVYTLGEYYSGVPKDVCSYQGAVSGVPNYAVYFPMIRAFTAGDMYTLSDMLKNVSAPGVCNDTTLLGSFSENHDLPRIASLNPDYALATNTLAFTLLADGIPMVYQGQEQHIQGNGTPYNRLPLWTTGYNTKSPLYNLTATLNTIRSHAIKVDSRYATQQATQLYVDNSTLVTRKGPEGAQIVAVFSNQGTQGGAYDLAVPNAFAAGTKIVEITNCTISTADSNGGIVVKMGAGLPKIFYPSYNLNGSGLCGTKSNSTSSSTKKSSASRAGTGAAMLSSLGLFVVMFLFL